MRLDRRDQQVRVIRPPIIDLVVGDDLIFRLLQLHHLAEFGRLAGLALADDFRLRLEQAHELAVAAWIGRPYVTALTINRLPENEIGH